MVHNFNDLSWLEITLVCNTNSCTIKVDYSPTDPAHNIPEKTRVDFSYFDGVTTQNIYFRPYGQAIITSSKEVTIVSNQVDILWVQDTSISLEEEVANVKSNFENFIKEINALGGDYQIAFITMRWNEGTDYNTNPHPPYSLLRRSTWAASWCFVGDITCNNDEIFTLTGDPDNSNDLGSFLNSFNDSDPLIDDPLTDWGLSFYGLEAVEYFLNDSNNWFRSEAQKHAIIVSDDDNVPRDGNDRNGRFPRELSGSLRDFLVGNITIHSIVGVTAVDCSLGEQINCPIQKVGQSYINFSNETGGTVSDIRSSFGDSLGGIAESVVRNRSIPLSLKSIEGSPCTSGMVVSCSFSRDGCTAFLKFSDLEDVRGETITVDYHSGGEQCE